MKVSAFMYAKLNTLGVTLSVIFHLKKINNVKVAKHMLINDTYLKWQ